MEWNPIYVAASLATIWLTAAEICKRIQFRKWRNSFSTRVGDPTMLTLAVALLLWPNPDRPFELFKSFVVSKVSDQQPGKASEKAESADGAVQPREN